jgi:uncharacterized protein (TIGR03086 family)
MTIDFAPATNTVATVVAGVSDDHLAAPTPCEEYTVAALLDHLMALTVAFKLGARKASVSVDGQAELAAESPPGEATGAHLRPDWRDQLPRRLDELAAAWQDPVAWEGEAEVGGVRLPAVLTAKVALNELVLHGWDLARATGQSFEVDPDSVEASLEFTSMLAQPGQEAIRNEIFGPPAEVAPDASAWERTLALSGRDPSS